MLLYLVRHAIAGDPDPERWPDDAERPLTSRGRRKFRCAAHGLRSVAEPATRVLSSPVTRAWQTAVLLAEHAGWGHPEPFAPLGGGASPWQVLDALAPVAGAPAVALVGHQPTMSELAALLLTGDPDRAQVQFKKGTVACFECEGSPRAGRAVLLWLAAPKMLRRAGGG